MFRPLEIISHASDMFTVNKSCGGLTENPSHVSACIFILRVYKKIQLCYLLIVYFILIKEQLKETKFPVKM